MHTPAERVTDYTQAIMDLGATVCTRARPRCGACPAHARCVAHRDGLTAALPTRKPARALPTRSTVMLVLRDRRGRVLFERRAPTGVWAGLWSLPEARDADAARDEIAARHGARLELPARPLPAFSHGFTHFRLDVQPLQFDLDAHAIADADGLRWLLPAEAATLGLPAPVRRLIAQFA
jgi:A/G-specific adenine glycosylase